MPLFVTRHTRIPLAQLQVCSLTMAGSVRVLFLGKGEKKENLHCQFYSERAHGDTALMDMHVFFIVSDTPRIMLFYCTHAIYPVVFYFFCPSPPPFLLVSSYERRKKNDGKAPCCFEFCGEPACSVWLYIFDIQTCTEINVRRCAYTCCLSVSVRFCLFLHRKAVKGAFSDFVGVCGQQNTL